MTEDTMIELDLTKVHTILLDKPGNTTRDRTHETGEKAMTEETLHRGIETLTGDAEMIARRGDVIGRLEETTLHPEGLLETILAIIVVTELMTIVPEMMIAIIEENLPQTKDGHPDLPSHLHAALVCP
jgi:hypothetical protein